MSKHDGYQPWQAELDRAFDDEEYPTRLALHDCDGDEWLEVTGDSL